MRFVWLLELYAFVLAVLQTAGGLRTDEAKYLLSIPYPHPPVLRTIFASTLHIPQQEFLWRFLLASILVQAVWLLWDLGCVLPLRRRMALAASWLLSAAFVVQTGSIMMAPLTALFGLVCVWIALRPVPVKASSVPLVGCFWFLGLFSAYQTLLFAPLLVGALRSSHTSWQKIFLYVGLPLLLLAGYTLTNPLLLASIVHVGTQDAPLLLSHRLFNVLWICLVAGSGMMTIVGLTGILSSGRPDLLATLALLLAFIGVTSQDYYAILLTPLLAAGVFLLLCKRRVSARLYLPFHVAMTACFVFLFFPPLHPTSARATMRFLKAQAIEGPVLIDGPFGHEWQYESSVPILRFTQDLSSAVEEKAQAIVCTKKTCEEDIDDTVWLRLNGAPVPVWIRR